MSYIIIITNDIVKPSSPTPLTSKIHIFSFRDQNAAPIYIPIIFFYRNDEESKHDHEEISRRLKHSLSKTLTIFYPLAGTINQNSHVDCNDRGAEFVEARFHSRRLSQFLQNPKMEELSQFLPTDSLSHDGNAILRVKASFFDCGGFSVGICLSHKIADASSALGFMNAWAATCREEEAASGIIPPSFDMSLHFPSRDNFSGSTGITKEERFAKRLVFEREKLEKLRKEASMVKDPRPSRVEAVSAFIWRSFIKAKKLKVKVRTETTSFTAAHAVNLRPRAVPPIPGHTFGNCVTLACAMVSSEDEDEKWNTSTGVLVSKLRAAIRGVGGGYINNVIKDDDGSNRLVNKTREVLKSENTCIFSSWLGFPVYEVDFGWGKPLWVGTATIQYINLVLLMETSTGDGVEAWISTPDDHFFRFLEADYNNLLT